MNLMLIHTTNIKKNKIRVLLKVGENMRKARNKAIFKSLCKQYQQNVDNSGFYKLLLGELNGIKIKQINK